MTNVADEYVRLCIHFVAILVSKSYIYDKYSKAFKVTNVQSRRYHTAIQHVLTAYAKQFR